MHITRFRADITFRKVSISKGIAVTKYHISRCYLVHLNLSKSLAKSKM